MPLSILCVFHAILLISTHLHWCLSVTKNNSLSIFVFGILDGDVAESDVLKDEVPVIHVAMSSGPFELGPEDAARLQILLGWSNPDGKLFWSFNVDILIENIGHSAALGLIATAKLHINSFPSMMHVTVPEEIYLHFNISTQFSEFYLNVMLLT